MTLLFDSFWRALAYCFRPKVMLLTLLPFVLMLLLAYAVNLFFWDTALAWATQQLLWLEGFGLATLRPMISGIMVVLLATPFIGLTSLLLVALLITPALTMLVAQKRFPMLERRAGAGWLLSVLWSLFSSVLALLAILLSMPLWLIPPLVLLLPPLIWGWLTYRVMAFDALAEHASSTERREIFRRHRVALLVMGVLCGYMGAAPSLIWASGLLFAATFVLLIPLAVWIYTWVFVLSALWFAHYCLAALQALRAERATNISPIAAELCEGSNIDLPPQSIAYDAEPPRPQLR
jgi:hypothetical protein